jgi:hypothetical protein
MVAARIFSADVRGAWRSAPGLISSLDGSPEMFVEHRKPEGPLPQVTAGVRGRDRTGDLRIVMPGFLSNPESRFLSDNFSNSEDVAPGES